MLIYLPIKSALSLNSGENLRLYVISISDIETLEHIPIRLYLNKQAHNK